MKRFHLLTASILSTSLALLAGCVGYNTTVMMSKSNAGLDMDTKPPTLEANISRKEIVVAPSFEGGQTPPVMASFGSKSGSGGSLGRFFFGVNQTFAGGDSALTMAKLYNAPTPPPEGAESDARFNSTLEISQFPKANEAGTAAWKRRLFGLARPGEVRPFVFGTDTQLGVKVGWTGMGSAAPETIKIGFSRKEMAVAPVMLEEDTSTGTPKKHKVKMPSFLATVDSDVKVSSDVSVAWIQYFATGKAADHLARQPGVRSAMLVRADPEQAQAFTAIDQEAAAGLVTLNTQINEIMDKVVVVTDGNKAVDEAKLTTIATGVAGLDAAWIKKFSAKPPEDLRRSLTTIKQNSVPALHANLSKLAQ